MHPNISAASLSALTNAALAHLPSGVPLNVGDVRAGSITQTAAYSYAALADLTGATEGRMALLLGADLLAAVTDTPSGSRTALETAIAAMEAAASAIGATAGSPRETNVATVGALVGAPFLLVELRGLSPAGSSALLLSDSVVRAVTGVGIAEESASPEQAQPAAAAVGIRASQAEAVRVDDRTVIARPESSTVAATPVTTATPTPTPVKPMNLGTEERSIEMLNGVSMDVTVEIGRTRLTVKELLSLVPGTVLELDRPAGAPADLLVNGRLVGRGEIVVLDEEFGLRVTEVVEQDDEA